MANTYSVHASSKLDKFTPMTSETPSKDTNMSFFKAVIQNDLNNLSIPLDYELVGNKLFFSLKIDTKIYKGTYRFELTFPDDYPFRSPKLTTSTKIFHPNIDQEGHVCLKVLREGWMPSYSVNSIIISLMCCFEYLSPEDALNTEAGDLLEQDYEEFVRRARSI